MTAILDCLGRLVCRVDENSGLVEIKYKGHTTKTIIKPGGEVEIHRQNSLTRLKRIDFDQFVVDSRAI